LIFCSNHHKLNESIYIKKDHCDQPYFASSCILLSSILDELKDQFQGNAAAMISTIAQVYLQNTGEKSPQETMLGDEKYNPGLLIQMYAEKQEMKAITDKTGTRTLTCRAFSRIGGIRKPNILILQRLRERFATVPIGARNQIIRMPISEGQRASARLVKLTNCMTKDPMPILAMKKVAHVLPRKYKPK
jgi:hypothetical protein